MKQRVQIARAIANDSDILIMDEPFGALDAQTRRLMQDELLGIWDATGKTILFVTHDIHEAVYLGQRISILSKAPDATILRQIEVDLPYPRTADNHQASELIRDIQKMFDAEEHYQVMAA
jgi:NitT/TauT family transport system ATP-binding protein